jgi:hypothetical protein
MLVRLEDVPSPDARLVVNRRLMNERLQRSIERVFAGTPSMSDAAYILYVLPTHDAR